MGTLYGQTAAFFVKILRITSESRLHFSTKFPTVSLLPFESHFRNRAGCPAVTPSPPPVVPFSMPSLEKRLQAAFRNREPPCPPPVPSGRNRLCLPDSRLPESTEAC